MLIRNSIGVSSEKYFEVTAEVYSEVSFEDFIGKTKSQLNEMIWREIWGDEFAEKWGETEYELSFDTLSWCHLCKFLVLDYPHSDLMHLDVAKLSSFLWKI